MKRLQELTVGKEYYPAICEKCGWCASSEYFNGEDGEDIICPKCFSNRVYDNEEDGYKAIITELVGKLERVDKIIIEVAKAPNSDQIFYQLRLAARIREAIELSPTPAEGESRD